jgi:hypothetical protein
MHRQREQRVQGNPFLADVPGSLPTACLEPFKQNIN